MFHDPILARIDMKRKKYTETDNLTKYYKATYTNGDSDVFIGTDVASAELYAKEENSRGRTLETIKEYQDVISALTDYQ